MSNLNLLNVKSALIVSGLVLIALITFLTLSKSNTIDDKVSYEFVEYEVKHPFPIDSTNLLPSELANNTNSQSRLNKYDVRAALDSVFKKQDFQMISDTFLTFGDLTFPLSSYDNVRRIGYIWLDYDRFGEGIQDKKLGESKTQKECELDFMKLVDDGLERYFDNEEVFLDDVFGNEMRIEEEKKRDQVLSDWRLAMDSMSRGEVEFQDIRVQYQAYQDLNRIENTSILEEWDFFGNTLNHDSEFVKTYGDEVRTQLSAIKSNGGKKEYLEIMLQDFRKILEVNYLSAKENKSMLDEWKLSAAEIIKEPRRFFGFISLIDQLRMHSPNRRLLTSLDDQIFKIDLYDNSKDWWKHSKAVIELFNVNKNPGLYNKESYQNLLSDIMSSNKYTKWQKRYHEIDALGDVEALSLLELKSIDGLAFQKGIYIAPISILDDRMIYDMEEDAYLEKLASLRAQIKVSKDKKTKKDLHEKLMDLSKDRSENYGEIRKKAKEKSILKLQNDLREYIKWAQEQSEMISYDY